MNLSELRRTLCHLPAQVRVLLALFAAVLLSVMTVADSPIASSSFVGAEDPLSENGLWVSVTAYSPYGTQLQKNNGAMADRLSPLNHAGSRTTAVVPPDQYSEIVVGQIATTSNNVGPLVRVQASGAETDSTYLWWASIAGGQNALFRLDAGVPDQTRGTSYTATSLFPTSPVVNGDRLRLIARGPVLYGLKNGVRDFIYNTGPDSTQYVSGSSGLLVYADGAVTNAIVSSWSTGPAPVSSGTWASTNFAGNENPLDENDRWYPLPRYNGFKKAGGLATGIDPNHNISGVWSIAAPPAQYSEVTLGTVSSGGGGPVVRIDRNNAGQTGWLLFLDANNSSSSGIYKMTPDGNFTPAQLFSPTIVAGDKWRLTADGNTLEVSQNGISQFTYTTDGSYPAGDVGIDAYTQAFTFSGWQGGSTASGTIPAISSFNPPSGPTGTSVTIDGTGFTGVTAVTFNGVAASFTITSDTVIQTAVPTGATNGPITVSTPAGAATSTNNFMVASPPAITSFAPTVGPAGSNVSINGSSFTAATAVTFNGLSASFSITSDTVIQSIVPAGAATGPVSVTTPSGTATSAGNFTVTESLTLTKLGTGNGTVTSTSNPVGSTEINCGTACSAVYNYGTVVTFTATPAVGSNFTAWAGCDSTSGATCTVTMNTARSVTATFTVQTFTLTVEKGSLLGLGLGNGIVTSVSSPASPGQINCGPTCSAAFNYGTVVTLTAKPQLLSVFDGWSGCDATSGMTCTVTVGAARKVTADFLP